VERDASVLALSLQLAGAGGAYGQKGDQGEPAVIEPVSDNLFQIITFSQ